MSELKPTATPIATYEKSGCMVAIYQDHIRVGKFIVDSYMINDIKDVRIGAVFIKWYLQFVMHDGSSSPEVRVDPEEIQACQRNIVDLILENQTAAGLEEKISTNLLQYVPVKLFLHNRAGVIIYEDRIDIKSINLDSCHIGEIREVKSERSGFQWTLWLVRHNGSKSSSVALGKDTTIACHQYIEKFLQDYQTTSSTGPIVTINCAVLGGTGIQVKQGDSCTAVFTDNIVQIVSGGYRFELKLEQLTSLEIDGPGRVESDAGMFGGGFGVEGALIGMGVATLINTLTTRSTTNTFLHLTWIGGELFLHTSSYTPQHTRVILSHVFSIMQSQKIPQSTDLVLQLERLKSLKDAGVLSDEEFTLAKAKLLI